MSWTTKILLGVAGAHILLLAVMIFRPASTAKRFEVSRVATVDLFETPDTELRPAAEEPEAAPPPEPPSDEPAPRPAPDRPPLPPRVTRRVETIPPPSSDLRERLARRLSEIQPDSRPAAADRRSAVSSEEKFPFGWYEDYLVRRLYELWEQPGRATVRQDQASALISFRIHRDGRIERIAVRRGSGSPHLDQSAMEAVRRADPLPPLPEGFRGPWRDVNILFELTD